MDYNELKEVMVDLIEADEVSKTQLNYMLEFIQGNGCTNQIRRLMDNIDER
tara:strand:- start:351 stop:503 length:153 start_codon:yes stop_codon:yes gene_type:complete